ncbi:MAG TPA: arylamine N-acetyltransferase [Lacunisphaera sp.]|jgi:N-hydroxyarylamine O-acetyltransferase
MSSADHSIDLPAYFARIGYTGSHTADLEALHAITRHHATSIPFENLDVLLGRGIDVSPAAVERKLVREQRGGYCFEQNHLLLLALRALGFDAVPVSARVRWQHPRDFIPPRTHLFLRVTIAGEPWLTDVGFGGISLTSAIRLDFDGEQSTPHESRRIVRESGRFFHQIRLGEEWNDACEFSGEEMPSIDRELANWWTSTNPNSKFRQNLMVARADTEGRRFTLNNREFIHRRGTEIIERRTLATADELLELLASRFDLHFPAGTRFGPAESSWPS